MPTRKVAVIAIGGNSLILSKDAQTVQDQYRALCVTGKHIVSLVELGYQVVVTYGNGPQVGFLLWRSEVAHATSGLHGLPLVTCVADTQGGIGYQIQQTLKNEFLRRGLCEDSIAVLTQVVVDKDDPGFRNPTKPVGAFLTEDEAVRLANETGATFKEDAGRGWRQVVASPAPVRIVEFDAVRDLVEDGYVVVSTGGGGVPVFETENGYVGTPAVIDKDRSSALMAAELGADMLIILTAVEKVCINFNTPEQEQISEMTVSQAREYIAQGQFAPGSMLPKVEACIEYVEAYPEGKALITSLECAAAGLRGETGTVIVAD